MTGRAFLAAAAALVISGVVFATTPVTIQEGGRGFDGLFYSAMAGDPQLNPDLAHVAPWAYRVATPALVSVLPSDTLTGFRAVVFLASVASLTLMFLILHQIGLDDRLCWIGVALYATVFWTLKFSFHAPAYIDAETQAVLLAIVYLTVAGRYGALIALLAVAPLQKESLAAFALFAVAALYREHRGRFTARTSVIAAALIVAPLVTVIAARSLVGIVNAVDTAEETREQLRLLLTPGYWPVLLHAAFSGLGLLGMVLLIGPRRWLHFVRERFEWIVYVALALVLVLGGRDKGRLLMPLVPAAVIFAMLAVAGLDMLKRGARGWTWIGALLVLHAFIGNLLTPLGTFEEYLAKLVPEHSSGTYLPYLVRNLTIAAAFTIATLAWLRFEPGVDGPERP